MKSNIALKAKSSQVYFITHHQQMYTKLIQVIFCKTHLPSAIPTQDLHNILTLCKNSPIKF